MLTSNKILTSFFILLHFYCFSNAYGQNMRKVNPRDLALIDELAYSTIRIVTINENDTFYVGTGFFFKYVLDSSKLYPVIITNRHVVEKAKVGFLCFTLMDNNGMILEGKKMEYEISDFKKQWIYHPNPKIDLAILPIHKIAFDQITHRPKYAFFPLEENMIPTQDELNKLFTVEEILMVGYPKGVWDSVYNLPIYRRGITATHPARKYKGKDYFLVDIPIYGGSSGSPIFICNDGTYAIKGRAANVTVGRRLFLLGVEFAGYTGREDESSFLPYENTANAKANSFVNLALVIRAERIMDFLPLLKKINNIK